MKQMGETSYVTAQYPLIENLSELISYIQTKNPSVDELCQFAVVRTFNFLGGIAMFQATLDPDGTIRNVGQFGFSKEVQESWKNNSINEDLPTADALKTNNIVWIADNDGWYKEYPHLAQYENEFMANTFIAWPISVRGAHMSVLGLCLNRIEPPTSELISFFETVGGIIALQQSKLNDAEFSETEHEIMKRYGLFTRRQRDVIHLISDGLTNIQIANELGFSESTIRQETMRIYEILGATGRADAIRMYRNLGITVP
jgi:DNA-binding CsgD family transcriptional regulator